MKNLWKIPQCWKGFLKSHINSGDLPESCYGEWQIYGFNTTPKWARISWDPSTF